MSAHFWPRIRSLKSYRQAVAESEARCRLAKWIIIRGRAFVSRAGCLSCSRSVAGRAPFARAGVCSLTWSRHGLRTGGSAWRGSARAPPFTAILLLRLVWARVELASSGLWVPWHPCWHRCWLRVSCIGTPWSAFVGHGSFLSTWHPWRCLVGRFHRQSLGSNLISKPLGGAARRGRPRMALKATAA